MKRLAILVIVLVAACGSNPSPTTVPSVAIASEAAVPTTQAATAGPTTSPTATPEPTPSPTADPEAIRAEAAKAYLAAAAVTNKASKKLDAKYKTFKSLKQARDYYRAAAKIDGTFIAALKKMTVPDDTKADLHSLIAKTAAAQALEIEGSAVKSWAAQGSVAASLTRAARAASAAANLIRSDLGLPPIPA